MEMYVYAIYDRVAGQFGAPMLAQNEATAHRAFNNSVASSPFSGDIDLYHLGSFNGETGVISALEKPEFIAHFEEAK